MPPKRSVTQKRQTKLSFSPVPTSSPRTAGLSPHIRSRAAAITLDGSPSRPSKKRKLVQLSDDSDTGFPTPKKSFQSNEYTPPKREIERGMRLGMPAHTQPRGMFGSSDNEQLSSSSTSEVESGEETVKQKPRTNRTRFSRKAQKPPLESEESESEHMPDTSPPPRRGRRPNRRQRASSFEVPDDEVELEESEDEVTPRRARNRRPTMIEIDSEVDKSDDGIKSSGRRLIRKKDSAKDRQEQEDLQEDLEFLRSSPPATTRRNSSKPMNERQKALAALKRRRASAAGEPSSSATPARKRAVILSDSEQSESDLEIVSEEDEIQGDDDEEDEEEEEDTHPVNVFQENADDGNFIDDDIDAPLGEPADVQVPLQFSSWSSKKPRELFKFAIEWMVQKKINPGFSSSDEIYEFTFRKLNDEVSGLANSKYSSSIWTPDFTRALRARPEIVIDEISAHMRAITSPHCEACNRTKHPATYSITFIGKPYNRETLEPLAEDSDDSSGSNSDSGLSSSEDDYRGPNGEKPTYDAQGEVIPPESRVFTVGSTCQANAQMAHTLHHWRHHLNTWVVDYLIREKHCTPEKLVQRDKWSERKRRKYANKIVDEMDENGEIKKLHRLYKEQVDFALEARNEYKQGWGRQ